MTKHKYLSDALSAFNHAAPIDPDYSWENGTERDLRNAPAPFSVVHFSLDVAINRVCPLYDHDCARERCGIRWSIGGETGVQLRDATGRVWREAGVIAG